MRFPLTTAGVWSIVMGVFFVIAQKNEDKEKARKMIKNYVIGLVVIFAILVACPYLVKIIHKNEINDYSSAFRTLSYRRT